MNDVTCENSNNKVLKMSNYTTANAFVDIHYEDGKIVN